MLQQLGYIIRWQVKNIGLCTNSVERKTWKFTKKVWWCQCVCLTMTWMTNFSVVKSTVADQTVNILSLTANLLLLGIQEWRRMLIVTFGWRNLRSTASFMCSNTVTIELMTTVRTRNAAAVRRCLQGGLVHCWLITPTALAWQYKPEACRTLLLIFYFLLLALSLVL